MALSFIVRSQPYYKLFATALENRFPHNNVGHFLPTVATFLLTGGHGKPCKWWEKRRSRRIPAFVTQGKHTLVASRQTRPVTRRETGQLPLLNFQKYVWLLDPTTSYNHFSPQRISAGCSPAPR